MSKANPSLSLGAGRAPSGRPLPRASALASNWRLDPNVVFLNHGSFGACPAVVLEKQRELRDRMEAEAIRFFVEEAEGLLAETGRFVAGLINADAAGVVHVPNSTAGLNTVVRSLVFEAGDELLTNSHEYNACNNVLEWAAEKWGARVVSVAAPFPLHDPTQLVDAIIGGLTPRTRLVLISHITSPTALVLPIEPVIAECNRRGIDVFVDGAHTPGQVPIDIARLQPAYYTGNFHKWLCAPKGSAFLWMRADRRRDIRPLIISHGANSARTDATRFRLEFDYTGTTDLTPYLSAPAAGEFLSGLVPGGLSALMAHNRANALAARDILCRALKVEPPAPDSMLAAMASVPLPMPRRGKIEPSRRGYHDALHDRLLERHGIQAPIMPPVAGASGAQRLVRVCMQAYNSLEQVEYLVECLREELARE